MKIKITDIAYHLPENSVTNDELKRENPDWDMTLVEARSGVKKRYIARDDETALDLAIKACNKLFEGNKNTQEKIDAIIFCTQSPDYIIPPNSCILHKILDLPDDVFCLDCNIACSGYIYCIAIAQGLICSGISKNLLLVAADTYSKFIHRQDRSSRVLFGDGASVSLLELSNSSQGIIDIQCSTAGKHYDKFIIPAGGCRKPKSKETAVPKIDNSGNIRTLENIHMDGMGILTFVNTKVPKQIRSILAQNGLSLDDIDLFIFHQASKLVLDSLTRLLKISQEKVFRNLSEVGNTVSASIPISIKEALESGKISRGDKILLAGFGAGLSWGTAIVEI
jgi:3-oxoacyl-[acyl-carrier-protein] synthase-3